MPKINGRYYVSEILGSVSEPQILGSEILGLAFFSNKVFFN